MKRLMAMLTAAITATCSVGFAQELLLTSWPTQAGTNAQVGQTDNDITVVGLNSYDQAGNATSIPLLTGTAAVQLTDTLYAATYDAPSNTVTALVMYQADPAQPVGGDAMAKAVLDTANHNNWHLPSSDPAVFIDPALGIRTMQAQGELVQAGTQFWVCSASGQLTLAGPGPVSVAELAVAEDPSLFPPAGPVYTGP